MGKFQFANKYRAIRVELKFTIVFKLVPLTFI